MQKAKRMLGVLLTLAMLIGLLPSMPAYALAPHNSFYDPSAATSLTYNDGSPLNLVNGGTHMTAVLPITIT